MRATLIWRESGTVASARMAAVTSPKPTPSSKLLMARRCPSAGRGYTERAACAWRQPVRWIVEGGSRVDSAFHLAPPQQSSAHVSARGQRVSFLAANNPESGYAFETNPKVYRSMHCVKIPDKPQNPGSDGLYATVHLTGRLAYHLGMARDLGLRRPVSVRRVHEKTRRAKVPSLYHQLL